MAKPGRVGDNETEVAPAATNGVKGVVDQDVRLTTRSATGTVVVGCKLPNGIILQLSTFESTTEPVMGGGHRDIQVGRKVGTKYVVRGPRVPFGEIPKFLMVGGYALTSGIPEDFWQRWLEQNKDSDIVRRELVVAYPMMEDVERHCRDNEKVMTGLEPIDPRNMPRGYQRIETAPEQTAKL